MAAPVLCACVKQIQYCGFCTRVQKIQYGDLGTCVQQINMTSPVLVDN